MLAKFIGKFIKYDLLAVVLTGAHSISTVIVI